MSDKPKEKTEPNPGRDTLGKPDTGAPATEPRNPGLREATPLRLTSSKRWDGMPD
jgi:hypothetical protein